MPIAAVVVGGVSTYGGKRRGVCVPSPSAAAAGAHQQRLQPVQRSTRSTPGRSRAP
ncbi:hypothetical protein ACRAWF_32990 [Streptomyces sp. L7]